MPGDGAPVTAPAPGGPVTGAPVIDTHHHVWDVAEQPGRAPAGHRQLRPHRTLWQARNGAPTRVLTGHDGPVLGVAFSPDSRLLATASEDRTARLWHAGTGSAIAILAGHGGRIWQVVFSPDGQLLATASQDKTARLWDTATGAPITTLAGHASAVWLAEFSQDGSLLATADEDHTVRIWEQHPRGM